MNGAMATLLLGALALVGACGRGKPKPRPSKEMANKPVAPRKRPPARRVSQSGPGVVKLWTTGSLDVPESVQYDAARKVLYVSCINGKPTEKNGKGYIAKVSLVGKLVKQRWATGLDAPKGMGLRGDTLYVTDITRVHAIDTLTGTIRKTITAPTTKFLNDIAVGPAGEVYVSDTVTGMIHVVRDQKLVPLVNTKRWKGANGMLMQGGALLVGTATGVVKVAPATRKAALVLPVQGFGMIDGLKAYGAFGYLMSNWKGRTQIVSHGGKVTVLLDTTAQQIQSADLEYVAPKRMLVIPTFFHNKVVAYRLR